MTAFLAVASALPFGTPIDSGALSRIAGNGVGLTAIGTTVAISGAAITHVDRAPNTPGAGLTTGGGRSSISVLLRFDGIQMAQRSIVGPLTIAVRTHGNVSLSDLSILPRD